MDNKSIVWGACWFNESIEALIHFFIKTTDVLSSMGLKVYPVIFDAKLKHNDNERKHISKHIKNVLIIHNEINIYPNKNYGVAAITEIANRIGSKYVAVVDPDWGIEQYSSFIQNILFPLFNGKADIVIPNIGDAAGRSNLLIGKAAISLFYPEYSNIIETAFPGSLAGLTDKIYTITSSSSYHFDWGGEWDIISLAIQNNMKLVSLPVNVENVRHRSNTSKILDAFQIWRAILSSDDIIRRYSNLKLYDKSILPYDDLSEKILSKESSAVELIDMVKKYAVNDTQKQLLYMILYPIASIIQEIDYVPDIEQSGILPYNKEDIKKLSSLAVYCAKSALLYSNKNIEEINKTSKKVSKQLWSDWDEKSQTIARNAIKNSISNGGVL